MEEIPRETLEKRLAHPLAPTIFAPADHEEAPAPSLIRGRRVRHPHYGYGVILAQEGSDETRLTVYFGCAGKKKFVERYADLTPA